MSLKSELKNEVFDFELQIATDYTNKIESKYSLIKNKIRSNKTLKDIDNRLYMCDKRAHEERHRLYQQMSEKRMKNILVILRKYYVINATKDSIENFYIIHNMFYLIDKRYIKINRCTPREENTFNKRVDYMRKNFKEGIDFLNKTIYRRKLK